MSGPTTKRLCIVGAGPKAAAIVARAAAWRMVHPSRRVPDVLVLEANDVGAAWIGGYGFTNGRLELCNAAEKDVGFPYPPGDDQSTEANVGRAVQKFSWFAFLTDIGGHAEWVDRGRPFPSHARWGKYLQWVFAQAKPDIRLAAKVVSVARQAAGGLDVTYNRLQNNYSETVDGVVLTGNGPARSRPIHPPTAANIFDARTFWCPAAQNTLEQLKQSGQEGPVAVIGDGGAAATIVAYLARVLEGTRIGVVSISEMGAFFPRGDGYAERQMFTDPSEWPQMTVKQRRDFLRRTEGGVVSARLKAVIDEAFNVQFIRGMVSRILELAPGDLRVEVDRGGGQPDLVEAALVVQAIGFDTWRLLTDIGGQLNPPSGKSLEDFQREVEEQMEDDLSLPVYAGLGRGLHVPALAALARGPGHANLGALGSLARAVLDPYV